jgi:hypothetical protein
MDEMIQFDTNYQQYLFEIPCFDIIKAKKYHIGIVEHQKNLAAVSFNTKKSHLSIVYY